MKRVRFQYLFQFPFSTKKKPHFVSLLLKKKKKEKENGPIWLNHNAQVQLNSLDDHLTLELVSLCLLNFETKHFAHQILE